MGNNRLADTKRSLKWFLIKKFFLIMFFIYFSEEAIGFCYEKLTLRTADILSSLQISISGGGNPISFALQTLLYSLATLLPGALPGYVQGSINKLMGDSLRIAVTSPLFTDRWSVILRIIVIVVVLMMLLISLLPWMIGAFYYYCVVTKKVNELMEEEKAQQQAYDQKRNLLLSDIAHDIKTPLTTLCGYSKALSDGVVKQEAKQREYLEAIYNKSKRMDDLITLLFEYVKMESSGFELHREEGDLGELVRECTAALYTDFEEKKISLDIDISEEAMPCLMDKVQLARAITNLLNNAIRYGKEGGRALVHVEDFCLTVADDGMAIDREFAAHIFEPFSRADKARGTAGGSGLGLSIAYKIVQMHGGELSVKLEYGQGYTKAFQIWMPS
ncbi:MAG: HAMP domain-containing histidine kinase [Lachnospiraceae bacterium]|nr:HAMP domain-containing histidine kinase [Lachnospiraceae bacterium]